MSQTELFGDTWDAIGEYRRRVGAGPRVQRCASCGQPMWWGYTRNGKRAPYDYTDGNCTNTSHFATCPDAKAHSRRGQKA